MFLNQNLCRKTQLIVVSLNLKPSNYLKNRSRKIPPLGFRILSHLEISRLDLNLIDDALSLDIAPWKLSAPAVRLDLAKLKKKKKKKKKDTTNPETYKHFYLQLSSSEKNSSLMVLKQRQESLRRLSPRNIPGNLFLVAFRTTAPYIWQN